MQTYMSKNVVNCNSVTVELPMYDNVHGFTEITNVYARRRRRSVCPIMCWLTGVILKWF